MSRGWQDVPLPEDMDPRMLLWRFFAKNYGWTPDQVEEAPLDVQTWFPLIENAASQAQEKMAKQEAKSARHSGVRR